MNKKYIYSLIFVCVSFNIAFAQMATKSSGNRYSAINRALFLYSNNDVQIHSPTKYNDGSHIITRDKASYDWENKWGNGMPNAYVSPDNKDINLYISYFLWPDATPNRNSLVGMTMMTTKGGALGNWQRPNLGLWYWNADEEGHAKISNINHESIGDWENTNIVLKDVESLGFTLDYTKGSEASDYVKWIYLPKYTSFNQFVSTYQMDASLDTEGAFTGLYKNYFATDFSLYENKCYFPAPFINADTHMGIGVVDDIYFLTSRVNAKSTIPIGNASRKRWRRSTISEIGTIFKEDRIDVDLDIALDMSSVNWEPYNLQPDRLLGFEGDLLWGYADMFYTEGASNEGQMRTELAMSNNGKTWTYIKPGIPFLDNGTASNADDHGTINIAKPIMDTRFHAADYPSELYYLYCSSNKRHNEGRDPGFSLAKLDYGKMASLTVGKESRTIYSMRPKNTTRQNVVTVDDMLKLNVFNCFHLKQNRRIGVLADIESDDSDSKAYVHIYAYDESVSSGIGQLFFAGRGKGRRSGYRKDYVEGQLVIQAEVLGKMESVSLWSSKFLIDYWLEKYRKSDRIVRLSEVQNIPVVLRADIYNSSFYGFRLGTDSILRGDLSLLETSAANNYVPKSTPYLSYIPTNPAHPQKTLYDNSDVFLPNEENIMQLKKGTFALEVFPNSTDAVKTYILTIGTKNRDPNNYIAIGQEGSSFFYEHMKEGIIIASASVAFVKDGNKKFVIALEAVDIDDRYFKKPEKQEYTPQLYVSDAGNYLEGVSEQIEPNWSWKHSGGAGCGCPITVLDSTVARANAFLQFESFNPGMDRIFVGGFLDAKHDFDGKIYNFEIASKLKPGTIFWK